MGGCLSVEAPQGLPEGHPGVADTPVRQPGGPHGATSAASAETVEAKVDPQLKAQASPNEAGLTEHSGKQHPLENETVLTQRLDLLKVKGLLTTLAAVDASHLGGAATAAELLQETLHVSLVSITSLAGSGGVPHVLLAAAGLGSDVLMQRLLMAGADCSSSRLLALGTSQKLQTSLRQAAASEEEAESLPEDWAVLYHMCGLKGFMSVPICAGGVVLGMLTVAAEEAQALDDRLEHKLGLLTIVLARFLRSEHSKAFCSLVQALASAQDQQQQLGDLLQGMANLMLQLTRVEVSVRLAVLPDQPGKALVIEQETTEAGEELVVIELELMDSLLGHSISTGKPSLIQNCMVHFQDTMQPLSDIFGSSKEAVGSIVVVPLFGEGEPEGGLYFTTRTPSNLQTLKAPILALSRQIKNLLHQEDGCSIRAITEFAMSAVVRSEGLQADMASGHGSNSSSTEQGQLECKGTPTPIRVVRLPMQPAEPNSKVMSFIAAPLGGKEDNQEGEAQQQQQQLQLQQAQQSHQRAARQSLDCLRKVLQSDMAGTLNRSVPSDFELQLGSCIGKGGFGAVHRAVWKGYNVAVKILNSSDHERQTMKAALEMAVLTNVRHPNIIHVYSCLTDMVEYGGQGFKKLMPQDPPYVLTQNLIVMEYCDLGCSWKALERGFFHWQAQDGLVTVHLPRLLQVLMEVAKALHYLHSVQLVHCDVKPENVLLKSDPSAPLGFVTKLSDFGLAKMVRQNGYIVNRSCSGSLCHLAPELYQVGTKVTSSIDSYAFGIMMWELYTGERPYAGMDRNHIMASVCWNRNSLEFPPGTPGMYRALAQLCWVPVPKMRPDFGTILRQLQALDKAPRAQLTPTFIRA